MKIAGAFALALLATLAPLRAQDLETPPPVVQSGAPCAAVIEVSWDVTGIEAAAKVSWELKADQDFTTPNVDTDRLDSGIWEGATGTESLDLRPHGSVLNGRPFFVRILARGPDGTKLAARSASAVYDPSVPSAYSDAALSAQPSGQVVDVTWDLHPAVAPCSTETAYEVARVQVEEGIPPWTVLDGPDPNAVESGTLSGPSGSTSLDFSGLESGYYRLRVFGRSGVGTSAADVGSRSLGDGFPLGLGSLHVTVTDQDGTTCGGSISSGAAATLVLDGPEQETVTADTGSHVFNVLPGTYTVTASRGSCSSPAETVVVSPVGYTSQHLVIPDCPPPSVDLAAALEASVSNPVAGEAFELVVTISHDDVDGPSGARTVRVTRETATGALPARNRGRTRPAVVEEATVEGMCMGETRTISVSDAAPKAGRWAYRARLAGRDSDAGNDTATVLVDAEAPPDPLPDLALSVEQSHPTLPPGATMTYEVSLANLGEASVSNAAVRNQVSMNLDFESAGGSHGFSCAEAGTNLLGLAVVCEGGDLPPGATASITLTASLPFDANAGHDLTFVSRADFEETVEESDEGNNHRILHATTGALDLVEHEVPDPLLNAFEFIGSRGYGQQVVKLSRGGECSISSIGAGVSPDATVVFTGDGGGPINSRTMCEFRLLRNKSLAEPWEVVSLELTRSDGAWQQGSSCRVVATEPEILVRLDHPAARGFTPGGLSPGRRTVCRVTGFTLRGPADESWQDAFE